MKCYCCEMSAACVSMLTHTSVTDGCSHIWMSGVRSQGVSLLMQATQKPAFCKCVLYCVPFRWLMSRQNSYHPTCFTIHKVKLYYTKKAVIHVVILHWEVELKTNDTSQNLLCIFWLNILRMWSPFVVYTISMRNVPPASWSKLWYRVLVVDLWKVASFTL